MDSCLLGDECFQDLSAVVDLALHREARQPSHECGGRVQGGRIDCRRVPAATPVHGAQQEHQGVLLTSLDLQPPPVRVEGAGERRQHSRAKAQPAAPSPLQAVQHRFGVVQESVEVARRPGAPQDRGGRRGPRPRCAASLPAREQGVADRWRCRLRKSSLSGEAAPLGLGLQGGAVSPSKPAPRRCMVHAETEKRQLVRLRNQDRQRHDA